MRQDTNTGTLLALRLATTAALLLFAAPSPAAPTGAPDHTPTLEELRSGNLPCRPVHFAALDERRRLIASAPTVERARELALQPASVARRALQFASFVAPSQDSIVEARARLDVYSNRVQESATPAEVAGELDRLLLIEPNDSGLIQLADVQVGDARVRGPGRCHYTTGEIVAVVIGFILFIIPGIILIFLLC